MAVEQCLQSIDHRPRILEVIAEIGRYLGRLSGSVPIQIVSGTVRE
jgi:hypothetical protein